MSIFDSHLSKEGRKVHDLAPNAAESTAVGRGMRTVAAQGPVQQAQLCMCPWPGRTPIYCRKQRKQNGG